MQKKSLDLTYFLQINDVINIVFLLQLCKNHVYYERQLLYAFFDLAKPKQPIPNRLASGSR